MNRTKILQLILAAAVGLAGVVAPASDTFAQTGVDDDRVSLPGGPGSIEGVGDDVQLSRNMGSASHNVAIELPSGFPGATPSLALSYSSGGGSGPLGIGWSMSLPAVGRMTSRGAPDYDTDDLFDVDGQELVRVGTRAGDLVYRARFEGGFTRYRWVDADAGAEGYWIGESPDGSVSYFGADASGALVASARKTRPQGGTAEYGLVETVDPYGHSVRYTYDVLDGTVPLLTGIRWLDDGTRAADIYSVELDYEARPDLLSDASRGYEELTANRLTKIRVKNETQIIREYVLTYQDDETAGGFTRLQRVETYGLGGVSGGSRYPVVHGFEYSQAFGVECEGSDCERPYLVDMGSVSGGISLGSGLATLIDINGDALPDILDTSPSSGHRFSINTLTPNGAGGFTQAFASASDSAIAGTQGFRLGGTGRVQTFDVDGDGKSDLLNASTGAWLANGGNGDWAAQRTFADISAIAGVDLSVARYIDIDDDKRVDLVTSTGETTTLYHNNGDSFSVASIAPLGVSFGGTSNVQFADMNGDGLNDPVELRSDGSVRYRLNLGHGQWTGWRTILGLEITPTDVARADLEDLNGDGVSDVVVVNQTQIRYAINRNGDRFDPFVTIDESNISGAIPERVAGVTVLYVDMNANGSEDIVWFSPDGRVQYLELFPRRPNLITAITNGIGSVQTLTYTTAAEASARARAAGQAWTHELPIAMQLVEQIDRYVTLTGRPDGSGLHEITTIVYRDGFYDGVEKQYRGFEQVRTTVAADTFQEESTTEYLYDVGRDEPFRKGLELSTTTLSDDRVLQVSTMTFEACALAEVPTPDALAAQGRMGVYFPCATANETIHQEGLTAPSEWKTTKSEMAYDGYGNVTLHADLGVVGVDGDELYTESTYVAPSTLWLIHLPARERVYDEPGIPDYAETLTYYDGAAFVGLPLGQATEGFVTRVTKKVDVEGDIISAIRARRDDHGNVVELIDPNGSVDDPSEHRRTYAYDATGLFLSTTNLAVGDHVLRRESRYDRNFHQVTEVTKWMLVIDDVVETNRDSNSYQYDDFGRMIAEILPGDDATTPSRVYTYELADPVSRIRMQARSVTNGALDEESFTCLDGRGRDYQTRTAIGGGAYQVSGFKAYNARGVVVRAWQPWVSTEGACTFEVPDDALSTSSRFDALGRSVEVTRPGTDIYGEELASRTEYLPLVTKAYDEEDTDSAGAHAATPVITTSDGLGRTIAIERTQMKDGQLVRSGDTLFYDATGTFAGYENAEGHRHRLTTDLLGRTIRIDDPNLGTLRYVYDDAHNLVSITDARGVVQRRAYDGQNRLVERWDEAARDASLVRWTYDVLPDGCARTECTNLPGKLAATSYPVALVDGAVVDGVDRMGYDVRRRTVLQARRLGELVDLISRSAFDNQDRMTSVTSPDGTTVDVTYDPSGRVVSIPGYVTNVSYEDRDLIAEVALANGARTTRGYDALMRLATLTHLDGAGSPINDLALTRNRVDAVASVTDRANAPIDLSVALEIDDWYRTETAAYTDWTESFGFDVLDRITSFDGESQTYDPLRPLAVAGRGDLMMAYDAGGNLRSRNGREFERDELGRVVRVSLDGVPTGVHAYADEDRVLQMTADGTLVVYGFGRYELRDGVGTTFVSLSDERIARRETTGFVSALYPDGNGNQRIDAGDALLASTRRVHLLGAAAARLLVDVESAVSFLHADHLRTIVAATDDAGQVRGRQAFRLHGADRASEGYVGAYGFTGQERDATTGFVHMLHRELDPSTGRWDRFDPKFVSLDAAAMTSLGNCSSGYAYAENNPGSRTDPSGLEPRPRAKIRKYKARAEPRQARRRSVSLAESHKSAPPPKKNDAPNKPAKQDKKKEKKDKYSAWRQPETIGFPSTNARLDAGIKYKPSFGGTSRWEITTMSNFIDVTQTYQTVLKQGTERTEMIEKAMWATVPDRGLEDPTVHTYNELYDFMAKF